MNLPVVIHSTAVAGTQRGLLVRDGPEFDAQEAISGHVGDGPRFHDQIIKESGSHLLIIIPDSDWDDDDDDDDDDTYINIIVIIHQWSINHDQSFE